MEVEIVFLTMMIMHRDDELTAKGIPWDLIPGSINVPCAICESDCRAAPSTQERIKAGEIVPICYVCALEVDQNAVRKATLSMSDKAIEERRAALKNMPDNPTEIY